MLAQTRSLLDDRGIHVRRASFLLDNKALIVQDQPDFLNQILEVETGLGPEELLAVLKEMETTLGRKARERYGPREIDIDILAFENQRVEKPHLTLPHPALMDRPYLRTLLADLGETPEGLVGF